MVRLFLWRLAARTPSEWLRAGAIRVWPLSELVIGYHGWRRRRRLPRLRAAASRHGAGPDAANGTGHGALVEALDADGVWSCTGADLFDDPGAVALLSAEADRVLALARVREQIAKRRSFDNSRWYVIRGYGNRPREPLPSALVKLILNDSLLRAFSAHLGVPCRLIYADYWYSVAVKDGEPPVPTERWHRDHEDDRTVKLMVYLSDVTEADGPLYYVRQTHAGGTHGDIAPHRSPAYVYVADERVKPLVERDLVAQAVGRKGDAIVFDGSGLHRGGRCHQGPRLVFVATFASECAVERRTYTVEDPAILQTLSPLARYALTGAGT